MVRIRQPTVPTTPKQKGGTTVDQLLLCNDRGECMYTDCSIANGFTKSSVLILYVCFVCTDLCFVSHSHTLQVSTSIRNIRKVYSPFKVKSKFFLIYT